MVPASGSPAIRLAAWRRLASSTRRGEIGPSMNRHSARRRANDLRLLRGIATALHPAVLLITLTACIPGRHKEAIVPLRIPARDTLLLADLHRVDTLAASGITGTRARYFAPDIVDLRSGAPADFGRDNVMAFLAANAGGETPVAWQPIGGGVSRHQMSGYTVGIAVYPSTE